MTRVFPFLPTRRLDAIVIVDVEATCWRGQPPPGEAQEIIEIGVCLLEVATGRRYQRASMLVRPERSTVSRYCTRLTKITPEMAAGGETFANACARLQDEFATDQRTWASWGNFDRKIFVHQCRERGVKYPFSDSHLNVKNLFALQHRLDREIGMPRAMARLGHRFDGTHHRGGDDAWNLAAVLAHVLEHGR